MKTTRNLADTLGVRLAAVLAATLIAAVPTAPTAPGASTPVVQEQAVEQRVAALGASWIEQQFSDEGWVIGRTGSADVATTIAAVLGIHATGHRHDRHDLTVAWVAARVDEYVRDQVDDYAPLGPGDRPGPLANLVLFALGVGEDPRDFGGHDLVARLEATEQVLGPDAGSFGRQVDAFGHGYVHATVVWALAAAGATPSPAAVAHLLDLQCATGGFPSGYRTLVQRVVDDCTGDSNATGLGARALASLDEAEHVAASRDRATTFLLDAVNPDGGWGYTPGDPTDGNSTGLAAAGLRAAGHDVAAAVAAVAALQFGCDADASDVGGVRYLAGDLGPNAFATYQAMLALGGATGGGGAEVPAPCPLVPA